MIESSEAKEVKQDYLEVLEALINKVFRQAESKKLSPSNEISISVGSEKIYKGQIGDKGLEKINPFISEDLVEKLNTAISNPEKLKGTVSIKIGKEEVFRVKNGKTEIDKLDLSRAISQKNTATQSQKNTTTQQQVEPVESFQKQIEALQRQVNDQQKLVDSLKSQPQSDESIAQLFSQIEQMKESLEKQQEVIEKTQEALTKINERSLPGIQNTKLQNWVGAVEKKVKQTAKSTFERIKDALTPEIVKLRKSVESQISEIKTQLQEQATSLKSEIESQVKKNVDDIRQGLDDKITAVQESIQSTRIEIAKGVDEVKQKAIESSVKALLEHFGQKNPDGSLTFKSKNFNFQQSGDVVTVKAKNGTEVLKNGALTSEVTSEQIADLEKIQPVVDEYLSANADLEYADAESEYLEAESEYLTDPEEEESLSRGLAH